MSKLMAAIRVPSYGGGERGGTAARCRGGFAVPGDGEVQRGAREHRGNGAKPNLGFSWQRREAKRAGRAHGGAAEPRGKGVGKVEERAKKLTAPLNRVEVDRMKGPCLVLVIE